MEKKVKIKLLKLYFKRRIGLIGIKGKTERNLIIVKKYYVGICYYNLIIIIWNDSMRTRLSS
jgi:hypothetical protein